MKPDDVDAAVVLACWRKLGGIDPPTPRQEARLRDVIAHAIGEDRRLRGAATSVALRDPLRVEIVAAYKAGQSTRQIAKWYGISHVSIQDRLRKMGVELRPRGGPS